MAESVGSIVRMAVAGMTCDHCVRSVRKAIESVPGVRSAAVDLASGRASVRVLPGWVDESRLSDAVSRAGYEATVEDVISIESPREPAVALAADEAGGVNDEEDGPSPPPTASPLVTLGPIRPASAPADGRVRELAVGGMHCGSCVSRVEQALTAVPGVRSAAVDLIGERAPRRGRSRGGRSRGPRTRRGRCWLFGPAHPGRGVRDASAGRAEACDDWPGPEDGSRVDRRGRRPHTRSVRLPGGTAAPGGRGGRAGGPARAVDPGDALRQLRGPGREGAAKGCRGSARPGSTWRPSGPGSSSTPDQVRPRRPSTGPSADAGYSRPDAADADPTRAAEAMRRERAERVAYWRRRLIVGVVLVGAAGRARARADARRRATWAHAAWVGWAMLVPAAMLQVYLGGPYIRGRSARLRQGSSNMDTLIALGTSTAFGYSLYHLLIGQHMQAHFFMDAGIILTLITLGKFLEARSKGAAGAGDRAAARPGAEDGAGRRGRRRRGEIAAVGGPPRRRGPGPAGGGDPGRRRGGRGGLGRRRVDAHRRVDAGPRRGPGTASPGRRRTATGPCSSGPPGSARTAPWSRSSRSSARRRGRRPACSGWPTGSPRSSCRSCWGSPW